MMDWCESSSFSMSGRRRMIVGRNGAGKTKRMRTLVGALRPLSGQIRFDDAEVGSRPGAARVRLGLGYMPEDRRLVPDLSVRANIALPLEVAGMAAAEIARKTDYVLSLIPELMPLIGRRGNQLSGGQQKLAALGRANCLWGPVAAAGRALEGRRTGAGGAVRIPVIRPAPPWRYPRSPASSCRTASSAAYRGRCRPPASYTA